MQKPDDDRQQERIAGSFSLRENQVFSHRRTREIIEEVFSYGNWKLVCMAVHAILLSLRGYEHKNGNHQRE